MLDTVLYFYAACVLNLPACVPMWHICGICGEAAAAEEVVRFPNPPPKAPVYWGGKKNRKILFTCAWKLKDGRTPLVRSHVTQLWEARQQNLPRRRLGQNRRAMMGLDLFWVLEASFFLCWPKNRICVNDAENTRLWWWLCRYREGVTTVENRWVIQHTRTKE